MNMFTFNFPCLFLSLAIYQNVLIWWCSIKIISCLANLFKLLVFEFAYVCSNFFLRISTNYIQNCKRGFVFFIFFLFDYLEQKKVFQKIIVCVSKTNAKKNVLISILSYTTFSVLIL